MIHHGDLFTVLPTLAEASIDTCVTDPPYGIGFMGKEWDSFAPGNVKTEFDLRQRTVFKGNSTPKNIQGRKRTPAASPSQIQYDRSLNAQRGFQEWTERWATEVYRVLKPGAYLVVCGAPRSHHRMMCGLEDAGFVVRDCFAWLFGSGFPKNYNLGDGKGTALKPAHEPIALAWKPFKGSIKACHETHGTAALNIDACRVGDEPVVSLKGLGDNRNLNDDAWKGIGHRPEPTTNLGRWPANVLLDDEAAAMLDEQTADVIHSAGEACENFCDTGASSWFTKQGGGAVNGMRFGDSGGASRFYYVAKPSREERDYGMYGEPARGGAEQFDSRWKEGTGEARKPLVRNGHPTVKPVELMRWLVKLVTPLNGTVLDPFTGSGTTGMACRYEQRGFIGIEREAEYVAIAERRIAAVCPLFAGDAA